VGATFRETYTISTYEPILNPVAEVKLFRRVRGLLDNMRDVTATVVQPGSRPDNISIVRLLTTRQHQQTLCVGFVPIMSYSLSMMLAILNHGLVAV
jgi:hypothetical protein